MRTHARQSIADLNDEETLRLWRMWRDAGKPGSEPMAADADRATGNPAPVFTAEAAKASERADAKSEREIQHQIRAWIEEHAGIAPAPVVIWQRMDRQATASLGTPDFIIALPNGLTCWMEVKTPQGRCSTDQLKMHARLAAVGHFVAVVRSLDDAMMVVRAAAGGQTAEVGG